MNLIYVINLQKGTYNLHKLIMTNTVNNRHFCFSYLR